MSKASKPAEENARLDHGVHTDPAALDELTDAASSETTEVGADGAVAGYRASRTLRLGVELRRQLRRRRTQLVLGFVALLPFILVVAFEIGDANPNNRSGGFIDLATASAPNFVVLAMFVSGSFLLPMIVALYFGDTIASESSCHPARHRLHHDPAGVGRRSRAAAERVDRGSARRGRRRGAGVDPFPDPRPDHRAR